MDRLYAPWRTQYVTKDKKKIDGFVFCHIANNNDSNYDKELGVLYRDEDFFIVMNKYPYSPGHFMIIPHTHKAKLEDLESNIWLHMNALAQKGVSLLKDVLKIDDINIGINLGSFAGAGIPEHLHLHLVPRHKGDSNFITTIAKTRVYSVDFDEIYSKLKIESSKYFND